MAIGDKPANLPEWASDAGAEITEPSAGKKASGWIKEKPPHHFFNWLSNLVYQWLAWVAIHKHNGTDLSRIELGNEAKTGVNGRFNVVQDTVSIVETRYEGDGGAPGAWGADIGRFNEARIGGGSDEVAIKNDLPSSDCLVSLFDDPTVANKPVAVVGNSFTALSLRDVNADHLLASPLTSSRYIDNTTKVIANHNFQDGAFGVHNFGYNVFESGANSQWQPVGNGSYFLPVEDSDNILGSCTWSAKGGLVQWLVQPEWDAANGRIIIRIFWWDPVAKIWESLDPGNTPASFDVNINIEIK